MISLTCTKCSTSLSVDDGFAGGVCRCSACGTIQTVPGKKQSAGTSGRSIYERGGAVADPAPTRPARRAKNDLDALSEAVTSSGLVGSGALRQARGRSATTTPPTSNRTRLIVLGASALIVLLGIAGVGYWLGSRGGASADPDAAIATPSPGPASPGVATPTRAKGPAFGPIALDAGGSVVYLLDRGDATRAYTAPLQRAVLKSVASLGPKRSFQVRYWTGDGERPAHPATPAAATPAALAKLGAWMNDVNGGRSTDALDSLAAALAARPAEIVLVTGKGWQLDDGFANEAIVKLGAAPTVRVHTVALGGSAGSDALARIAAKTGGRSIDLDESALSSLGQ